MVSMNVRFRLTTNYLLFHFLLLKKQYRNKKINVNCFAIHCLKEPLLRESSPSIKYECLKYLQYIRDKVRSLIRS